MIKNIDKLPEMFIQNTDGTKTKIGKIYSAEIFNEDNDQISDIHIFTPRKTATFEVEWNPTVDVVFLLIHGRFPSNNWRKIHGYPLRRKGR